MTSAAVIDARLEDLCQRATAAASALAGHRLDFKAKDRDGFWTFHCPLPGPDNDPHQWKGEPQARTKMVSGRIQAGCSKCTGGSFDDAYTARVLAAVGWTANVTEIQFGAAHSRHHHYRTFDDRYEVRRTKLSFQDRRKNPLWLWAIRDLRAGAFGGFDSFKPREFCAEHYAGLKDFYLALHLYGAEHFPPDTPYRVTICEGERDADTFHAIMTAAGVTGWVATTLPIQTPGALLAHQHAALEGRDVVLIGDADEGGERFIRAWQAVLAGVAATVRIFPSELLELSGGKDLSDHVEQQENAGLTRATIARRLIEKINGLPIAEPPVLVNWRQALTVTKSTGVVRDSGGNAKIVLTAHPDLCDRLRFNLRSGEVEIVDAPWGDTLGAHRIATEASLWLEPTENIILKPRTFEEALLSAAVAPAYDPLAMLGKVAWDGMLRLDGLFTHYLHLDLAPDQAVQLARLFMGDLVATLRNELIRQRIIVGVATDLELDVAGALLSRHGVQYHGGTVRERQVAVFARQQAALVQVGMTTISDRQVARYSLPQMFAPFVQVGHRQISSPVFLALGESAADPRTAAKRDPRCLVLKLRGHAIDALAADAQQIIAEGIARAAELAATPVLVRSGVMTADAHDAREQTRHALEIIYLFATQDLDLNPAHPLNPEALRRAPPRAEPLRHIVRSQCLVVMKTLWLAAHRDVPAQEAVFNAACRSMGWFRPDEKVAVTVGPRAAERIGLRLETLPKITVPGVLLTAERFTALKTYLFSDTNPPDDLPPYGGQESETAPSAPSPLPVEIPRETAAAPIPPEGTCTGEKNNCYPIPCAHARVYTRDSSYLGGAAAVAEVQAILAEPGCCAIDFETYPTAASWHGDQAALAAPRGKKGEARAQAARTAELNGRAHLRRPCVLSLRHENGAEIVVWLAGGDDPAARRRELQAMFGGARRRATLVAHNAQSECEVLLGHGVALDIECTQLMAKCLLAIAYDREEHKQAPPVRFGLADLVEREFGRARSKAPRDRDWRLEESLDEGGVEYCRQDARDALALYQLYRTRLEAEGLFGGYRLIQRAILPTSAISLVGMEFDAEAHRALTLHLRNRAARLKRILDQICEGAIHNHDSPQQLRKWIMDQVLAGDYADDPNQIGNFVARLCSVTGGEVSWKLTKKTKALAITKNVKAHQARALAPYYPVVARYLRASALQTQVTKLAGSFGETLVRWVDIDGRLRSQVAVAGTVTLRHNAQHPPMQEIPRRKAFRRLFRAPQGRRLIGCDYSQIELRLAAIVAPDGALLEVYRRGDDVHAAVASNVSLPRSQAKPVSFTMIYGGGASKVAESAGVAPERGQDVLEGFLRAYPGIAAYRERAPREAQATGFIAIRPGRRVLYDPAVSKPPQAVNYPIQGGAASVQMLCLRRVYDVLAQQPWLDTRVVAAIHDEMLLESPHDERADIAASILQHEMRQALLEVYPEAEAMGADQLAEAEVLTSWAEKS